MSSSHKYNRSEGCSICSTKNSTSQFRPWYDHYSEETYCRVFKLPSLSGRRGFVCNPCVLYIKRAILSLDSPTREQLANPPNHQKRLDSKLKGEVRPVIQDIFPPDAAGNVQASTSKDLGYYIRQMKAQPKYVYTGKPYIKLKSKHQLMPAGPWHDPREFLEDEDNAEDDLKYYRSVTLKKGIKTKAQKAEEKRLKEAEEDARLFGEIEDCCTKKNPKTYGKRSSRKKAGSSSKASSTRSKRKCTIDPQSDIDEVDSDVESKTPSIYTDDSDESASEAKQACDDPDIEIASEASCSSFRKRKSVEDETAGPSKMPRCSSTMSVDEEQLKDCEIMETEPGKAPAPAPEPRRINRRFPRRPVKDKKPPKVSFMDCSYWQKYPMCCADLYVGEGGMVVVSPHMEGVDPKSLKCPVLAQHTARRLATIRQKRRLKLQSQEASKATMASKTAAAALSESAKKEIAPSPMSSGDDELNDSRNFTTSPMVEASLHVQAFNFFGDQCEKGKPQSSTSKASTSSASSSS